MVKEMIKAEVAGRKGEEELHLC